MKAAEAPGLDNPALPRPSVGISACLAGFPVRYDGGDKRSITCMEQLSRTLNWLPLCPEMAIGLGTPRPTLDLHCQDGDILAFNRDNPTLNPSPQLRAFADEVTVRHPNLCGYVFMPRSPSCALHSARLYQGDKLISTQAPGLFAQRWRNRHPGIPAIESTELEQAASRLVFLLQCYLVHGRRLLKDAAPPERKALEDSFHPLAEHLCLRFFASGPGTGGTPELITALLMGKWPEPQQGATALGESLRDLSQNSSTGCRALCLRLLAGAEFKGV